MSTFSCLVSTPSASNGEPRPFGFVGFGPGDNLSSLFDPIKSACSSGGLERGLSLTVCTTVRGVAPRLEAAFQTLLLWVPLCSEDSGI